MLEQRWTLDVAPRGEGLAVVEVAIDGALSSGSTGWAACATANWEVA